MSGFGFKSPGTVAGGSTLVTTADTSQAIIIPYGANQFWVQSDGYIFFSVRAGSAPVTLSLANATVMGPGVYGPFMKNADANTLRYIHIAGNGGTPKITVTVA